MEHDRKVLQSKACAPVPLLEMKSSSPSKVLSRKARVLLVAATVIATVVFHTVKHILYASETNLSHNVGSLRAEFDWYAIKPSKDIEWTSCYDGQQCARLLLPLDYDTPSGPTTAIALRMIPARNRTSYRGTLLINPGGPGGSGTDLVERGGTNISRIVGDSFDVLGFDPRGVGASTPRLDCFDSTGQRDVWTTQAGHRFLNASDESLLGLYRARERVVGMRCEEVGGEWGIGKFMSTASVATDMLKITEKLGQEKVHYWGFSYGSILGQYFAAMYPDKVGRVIIDGVFDSHNYRGALWNSNLLDNEAVINSLFTYCHAAGPLKCGLYESTPEKIRARYSRVLDEVARNPIAVPHANPPIVITDQTLVIQIFRAAYKPLFAFGFVVDTIRAIEIRNETALAALSRKITTPIECNCSSGEPWLAETDAFYAIACGDGDESTYDADRYAKFYEDIVAEAPHAGPIWAVYHLKCTEWRVRPKWRYTGALGAANTSYPLLIVQPRWDPVCPLRDALAVRERYPGAGLVVQNSHGHCSLSAPSLCTAKYVRAYLEDGTLPDEGTVCEADELPFVGQAKDFRALSAEDAELLAAMRGLSEVVPMPGTL